MSKSDVYYETMYKNDKGKRCRYRTKSLTEYHAFIRSEAEKQGTFARTLKCDPSVPWPFGVYAEVVAEVKRRRA